MLRANSAAHQQLNVTNAYGQSQKQQQQQPRQQQKYELRNETEEDCKFTVICVQFVNWIYYMHMKTASNAFGTSR